MTLRVTVLELPAMYGDPARACALVDDLLARGAPTDLVLLPEASLTGYVSPQGDFDLTRFAEPADGPTARALAGIAARRGVHLAGPLVLREGDRCFNALACFDPGGATVFTYRKRHPWYPEAWATPGPDPHPVARVAGHAVTAAICFDGHFLADEAADALARADLLLFASAWVDDADSRTPLLAGLARRFGVAVANANWGRGAVRVRGQGGSCVIDPRGAVVARVAPGVVRADAVVEKRA